MKAIRVHAFGGPEVLKLEEIPDPVPGPGQVSVRVRAIGVNPVETYIRSGKYGPKPFPFIPGTDAAGTIESIGAGVTGQKAGDRVYVYVPSGNAYAEKLVCSTSQVHRLPDQLSFEQGAAVGVPYGTAYRALFIRGHARPAETILIHGGTGGVGTAAVQLAHHLGMIVLTTGGTKKGREQAKRQGAHHVFDHHDPHYTKQIMEVTQERGVDLIIELLANVNIGKDLKMLAKRGRVVVVGNRGNSELDLRDTMIKDSDIRGMSLMHADEAELRLIHSALGAGFANGTLIPLVGKQFPLPEVARAHEAVMEGGASGKIVLIA